MLLYSGGNLIAPLSKRFTGMLVSALCLGPWWRVDARTATVDIASTVWSPIIALGHGVRAMDQMRDTISSVTYDRDRFRKIHRGD